MSKKMKMAGIILKSSSISTVTAASNNLTPNGVFALNSREKRPVAPCLQKGISSTSGETIKTRTTIQAHRAITVSEEEGSRTLESLYWSG